jgi:hypothetical protein
MLGGPSVQVPDTTKRQWALIRAWMQALLQGKPGPSVSLEDALQLMPAVHKVRCVDRSGIGCRHSTCNPATEQRCCSYTDKPPVFCMACHQTPCYTCTLSLQYNFVGILRNLDEMMPALIKDFTLEPGQPGSVLK